VKLPINEIQSDMIQEFNVDQKAEYDQLNLAHETKTNASTHDKRQCPQHTPVHQYRSMLQDADFIFV